MMGVGFGMPTAMVTVVFAVTLVSTTLPTRGSLRVRRRRSGCAVGFWLEGGEAWDVSTFPALIKILCRRGGRGVGGCFGVRLEGSKLWSRWPPLHARAAAVATGDCEARVQDWRPTQRNANLKLVGCGRGVVIMQVDRSQARVS